jgi:hypothetical protein
MHGLDPSRLLGFGLNALFANQVEEDGGAVAHQRDEAFACLSVPGDDVVRVGAREGGDHLAVVAARRAPARFHGFEHRDRDAGAPQVQGR